MAIKELADGRWIVYYRSRDGSGKICREYFGRGAEGEAAASARERELGLRRHRGRKPAGGTTFFELAMAYARNKNFSLNSLNHLEIRLTANILPHFGHLPAAQITHADMAAYVKKRVNSVKYSTIRRELTDIKAILNWATRQQPPLIAVNPVRDYEAPKADDEIIDPPTTAEVKKILAAAAPHLKRALLLAWYCGMRPGAVELLSLTWASVNWERQILYVRSAHKGGPVRREVPIHPQLLPLLQQWREADKKIFAKIEDAPIVHYHKKPIKKIQTAWAGALAAAKIKRRIRPYDLRHQFVSRYLEDGSDLKTISEIVGSDPKTLWKHYQHVSTRARRDTISRLPGMEVPPPAPRKKKGKKKGNPRS